MHDVLPPTETWESIVQPETNPASCVKIDDALVLPVLSDKRADAITLLESVPYVALDEGRASSLTEQWTPKANAYVSATRLVAVTIALLEEREVLVTTKHVGGFSLADKNRLDGLRKLMQSQSLSKLMPYLVRGIVKNEWTGGFSAALCDGDLWISHLSLGVRVPPSRRVPVVVFLEKAPAHVYVKWGMAR